MAPGKKGRPPAAKSAQNTGRRAGDSLPANATQKPTAAKGQKREASDDLESDQSVSQDEAAAEGSARPKVARGRPRTKAAKLSVEPSPRENSDQVPQPSKRGRKPKFQAVPSPVLAEIPETQQPEPQIPETQLGEDLDESMENDLVDELPVPRHSRSVVSSAQPLRYYNAAFSASRRQVSGSDSELNDPSLRRRIGDLTRKYDCLEAKYRDLHDVGIKEAERNYEQLKKQGEERAESRSCSHRNAGLILTDNVAAKQLISTLKAHLAAQTELAKEGQRLKQQVETSESTVADLQNTVVSLNASLSQAKIEIKTLSTKLSASRAVEAATVKIPGSAIKGSTANNRMLASAESAMQAAQLKEDLYADLTGLIVRGIKRENDVEVYDCIQTGRNGSKTLFPPMVLRGRADNYSALHFKLSIGPDEDADEFEEAQFMYLPQLDANRDKALLDVLPDYLTEEISFPRPHAAKFYTRVMKALTERLD